MSLRQSIFHFRQAETALICLSNFQDNVKKQKQKPGVILNNSLTATQNAPPIFVSIILDAH